MNVPSIKKSAIELFRGSTRNAAHVRRPTIRPNQENSDLINDSSGEFSRRAETTFGTETTDGSVFVTDLQIAMKVVGDK